ncbi:Ig-like domain-containing protein [Serratia sp. D1N4]
MNFAFLTDEETLFFYPIDKIDSLYLPIQSIEGARYIITEENGADINENLAAERVNNDLHLKFYADSQTPSTIVIKDFALTNGKVFSLTNNGEYRQHLSAEDMPVQGAVALTNLYLGTQQEQTEAVSLKVIQHAATLQTLEKMAESLNPTSDAAPDQTDVTTVADAMPLSAENPAENAVFSVVPSITTVYDQVGGRQGTLVSGSVTDDKTPKLKGVGQPGAQLDVFQNGEFIGFTQVDMTGNWSFTPSVPLQEGGQLLYVRDPATNQTSGNIVLIIDTVAPSRSEISSVVADNTGTVGAIGKNGYTNDNTPIISGKGEANCLITIYNGNALVGTTYADQSGMWSFTPISPLIDGRYEFRAVGIDFSGNTGLSSAKFNFTIDTLPPDQPQIVEIVDNVGAVTGPVLSGAATDDNTPTLNGRAEAGSKVALYDNGNKIGEVQADASGNWSFTPIAPLDPGSHSFTVTATDITGNVSKVSQPWNINIVLGMPDAPVVDSVYDDYGDIVHSLESGDVTDDATPSIAGTAVPSSTVIIYDNGQEIARVAADASGNWNFTPGTPLVDGNHDLTFVTLNQAGNYSEASSPWVVIVDTTAPDAPTIGSIYDDAGSKTGELQPGDVTDDTTPTLKGQAEAGAKVELYDNGKKIGETTADAEGNWVFTPESELAEGEHSLTARATDAMGNISAMSPPRELVIDITSPEQPGIDGNGPGIGEVIDDQGPVQGPIGQGETTDDTTPTLNGKGEPGDTIVVLDNGNKIGETTVDKDGNWSFTPETELSEGEHEISVIIEDPAGNQSEPSDPWVVIVDTTAPDAPTIGSIYDDAGSKTGELQPGDVTDDTTPTLKGQAEAGAKVELYDNGKKIGETTADAEGNWVFTPESELAEGEHSLTTRATDAAGNTSAMSLPWELVIDITPPEQPGTDGNGPGIGEVLDDQGSVQGPILSGGTTDDTKPTLNGKGEPGDTIVVLDNGNKIGETTVDENGEWSFTPETELSEGEHEISVIIEDPAGNQSEPSEPWVVIVDTTAPEAPTIGSIYDDAGSKTGELQPGDVTDDTTPTLNGQAEAGAKVELYDNGKKIGETTADAEGNWAFTPESELVEGEHSFTTRATDAAGNTSAMSLPWELVIDITPPEQPGIDGNGPGIGEIIDDQGPVQGPIAKGETTDDTKPTLNGKGEPGDTIVVLDNGNKIGETTVDKDGNWSFTPETELSEGEHEISVIVEDPAGNQSEPSDPWVVIVDTTAPDAPTIGSIYDDAGSKRGELQPGDVTDDTTPTLNGQAEAGAKVEIYDNGNKIGETTANANGDWSFTPESELVEGEHSFTTRATDAAGNTSAMSLPWELVIDITPPEQPGIDGNGPGIGEIIDDQGPVQGPIAKGETTDDTKPTLNGKGEPGDTIVVLDNGNKIGETTVDKDGNWSFTPETELSECEHEISVIVEDPAGNQSKPSDPWVVIVDTTAPDVPTIGSVYDDVGEKTGVLEPGETTDDTMPTLKGQAEVGAKVEIYDNGKKIGETTADAEGNWVFTPESELAEGEHSFTVRATDGAGNQSGSSEAWQTTIIVQLPEMPVIESVIDDVGALTGELVSGDVTDDRRPEISGRSEPDVTVIVYGRGVEIGRGKADAQGHWSVTPENDLNDGEYSLTAVVVNVAGNSSAASDPFELIVYTGNGPTQVARLSQMGKDSGHDGNDFVSDNGSVGRLMHGTLSAELTAGQTLQVSTDGGRNWFNALTDGTKWAAQDLSLHVASWAIQTRVVDQSGNAGFVMSQAVTLDITAPRAPAAVRLEGSSLLVEFDPQNVAVGERIAVVADGGTQRFEHTLTAQDIAAGSVTLDVGSANSASVALVDLAGNLSGFTNTSGAVPGVNMAVTGDVSEVYGQNRDNIFTVDDVNALNSVKVIEGNGGIDILKLTGADQVLDLSAWTGRLSSVEVIDITGSGNNTLKLSLGDVLDQGSRGAFINDDSVQLAVKGDAGDMVMLSDLLPNGMDVGDWENLGQVISAGISYDVYLHTGLDAELLVQQGVSVQFS